MMTLAVFHELTTRQALLYAQAQLHIGKFNLACSRPLVSDEIKQALEQRALLAIEVFKESLFKESLKER